MTCVVSLAAARSWVWPWGDTTSPSCSGWKTVRRLRTSSAPKHGAALMSVLLSSRLCRVRVCVFGIDGVGPRWDPSNVSGAVDQQRADVQEAWWSAAQWATHTSCIAWFAHAAEERGRRWSTVLQDMLLLLFFCLLCRSLGAGAWESSAHGLDLCHFSQRWMNLHTFAAADRATRWVFFLFPLHWCNCVQVWRLQDGTCGALCWTGTSGGWTGRQSTTKTAELHVDIWHRVCLVMFNKKMWNKFLSH